MGVPGLWDLIRPAVVRTSLSELGREGFLENKNNNRAFTIGVDASIWIFHARQTTKGANAFQRTIFYKLGALLQHPIHVVFVFDGSSKPAQKRGVKVAGRFGVNDGYSKRFRELLDVCGIEWWNAPGEAEAELALMSRHGKIDAVLSDDVDALLFGATCLIRNNSPTLSGAQASSTQTNSAKSELRHYDMYRIRDICAEWAIEGSALHSEEDCQMAMVLIAILSGGDYVPEGASRMGPTKSLALAQAGHAEFLKLYTTRRSTFDRSLSDVRDNMVQELATNSSGFVGRRYRKDADALTYLSPHQLFPAVPLESYLCPITSPKDDPSMGWPGFGKGERTASRGKARNCGGLDLEGMARAGELFFEWGTRDIVCKKFSNDFNLFGAEIITQARRVRAASKDVGTAQASIPQDHSLTGPPGRLTSYFRQATVRTTADSRDDNSIPAHLLKIYSTRTSPTCHDITEYRLAYRPEPFVQRVRNAMDGTRPDPSTLSAAERAELGLVETDKATDTTIKDEIRIWVPGYLLEHAWPALIRQYEAELEAKAAAKSTPKKKKPTAAKTTKTTQRGSAVGDPEAFRNFFIKGPAAGPAARENEPYPSSSQTLPTTRSSSPSRRRSPRLARPRTPTPRHTIEILSSPPSPSEPRHSYLSEVEKRSHSVVSDSSSTTTGTSKSTYRTRSSPTKRRTPRPAPAPHPVRTQSTGSAGQPIDLTLSSDEDTPKAPRVLQASTAANRRAPSSTPSHRIPTKSPSARLSASKSPPTSTTSSKSPASQTLLTGMIIGRPRPKPVVKPPPVRLPEYVVYEDEDGVEHIDFCQNRK